MLNDFFVRALLAGVGVAIVAGPLGCFIVWRRMAFFGDTLAHSALLGVVIALLTEMHTTIGVFLVSALVALLLYFLQKKPSLSSDALLGLMSHSALALGLVALAFMTWIRVDLLDFLFGDILSVNHSDLLVIYGSAILILVVLGIIWHPLLAATVNVDLARAEGLNPARTNLIFMLLMACMIAISMKIVGVLLITALLVIPAATARRLASGPETMAVIATGLGVASVVAGLYASLEWDSPSGPSIVVAAFVMFLLSLLPIGKFGKGSKL